MIGLPRNEVDILRWRERVNSHLNGVVFLKQYATADLPTLKSTDRAIAWDSTTSAMVTWNGTGWV